MLFFFGDIRAVENCSLCVQMGEIIALIGPNGAGKTTLFNCITGIYRPSRGDILITAPDSQKSESIIKLDPARITHRGLTRTFQNIRLFSDMTVLENVMVGRHSRLSANFYDALFFTSRAKKEEEKLVHDSYALLETVGIAPYANEHARSLSYGAQRRLEIARALATDPFLLLLDEPAAGMNPQETQDLIALITHLRERVTIFLIEHDMSLVMSLADRIYVMDHGSLIAEGTPEHVRSNTKVIAAYLGTPEDA